MVTRRIQSKKLEVILSHGGDRIPLQMSKTASLFHEVFPPQLSLKLGSSLQKQQTLGNKVEPWWWRRCWTVKNGAIFIGQKKGATRGHGGNLNVLLSERSQSKKAADSDSNYMTSWKKQKYRGSPEKLVSRSSGGVGRNEQVEHRRVFRAVKLFCMKLSWWICDILQEWTLM